MGLRDFMDGGQGEMSARVDMQAGDSISVPSSLANPSKHPEPTSPHGMLTFSEHKKAAHVAVHGALEHAECLNLAKAEELHAGPPHEWQLSNSPALTLIISFLPCRALSWGSSRVRL